MTDVSSTIPLPLRRPAGIIIGMALIAKLAFFGVFTLNTRFEMDEFWTVAQTNWLWNGFFTSIWPEKAVGYVLFYDLARVSGWDSVSILLIARGTTAILAIGVAATVYRMTRLVGYGPLAALLAVLVLFCLNNYIERGFRLRSEPLALLFAALALMVTMQGNADQAKRLLLAGILSGLAFVTTQKSVYFNVALGVALVADALMLRMWGAIIRRSALLIGGWLVAVAIYTVGFGGLAPSGVLRMLIFGPVEVATVAQEMYPGIRAFVSQTLLQNALLYGPCFAGLVLALSRYPHLTQPQRLQAVFTLVITALVFSHNQPWPYVFIMAQPFLASHALMPLLAQDRGRFIPGIWLVALALALPLSFGRNVHYLSHDNREQLATVLEAERLIPVDGSYFDGIGMVPSRRMDPRIWLDAIEVRKTLTQGTSSTLAQAFANVPPDVVILSYRTDLVASQIGGILDERYVQAGANLMIRRDLRPEAVVAVPPKVDLFSGVYTY